MKAEHRKELETNVLAARMGRMVERMKTRPKRRTMLYVILGVVVLIVAFIAYRMQQQKINDRSERWVMLEDGFRPYIDLLKHDYPETEAGKAARFQYAWLAAWDLGLKILGTDSVRALENMEVAESMYLQLKKDCADDPVWEPEALYSLAVIEEARAVRKKERSKHLDNAQTMFQELAKKHKNSAHGKTAAKRAEVLEKDRQQIVAFYDDLQSRLRIPEEAPPEPKKIGKSK